jgi:CheY-like chemotaxis protein
MQKKDRLLKISELNEFKIRQLAGTNLDSYFVIADLFIDSFPSQEESVKVALSAKDRATLAKSLSSLCDILRKLYADNLAEWCAGYLSRIDSVEYEQLQTFIIVFLKAASALSIDLQMVEHSNAAADTAGETSEQPTSRKKQKPVDENSILAVDDEQFFLTYIKTMLQDSGYKLTCISTGKGALNYLKTNRPSLFILDINMPEMDGYELASKIRESGHNAPIIFLTGDAKKNSVSKAMQAGGNDFMVKPVSKSQLLERISANIKS